MRREWTDVQHMQGGRMSSNVKGREPLVHFERIGQIAITVSDVARAKNFYQNTLGMKFLFDAGQLCFFQCGEIRLMIGTSEKPEPRGGTILYFNVDDIHETYRLLKEQNVEFFQAPHLVAKMPDHDLWMAFLKDPDDNTLGVMCEVARA
jgi:methylmalonyl-CoA/ethylmalonyl-CoA epimerase